MKNYCQQHLKSLKHMADEVEIGLTESEYHVLNGDDKINIIHQIMCEGVELLKMEARFRSYCEYNNKDFEDCLIIRFLKEGAMTVKFPDEESYSLKAGELFLSYGGRRTTEVLIPKPETKIKLLMLILSKDYLENFSEDKEVEKSVRYLRENLVPNEKKFIRNTQKKLLNILDLVMKYEAKWGKKFFAFSKVNEGMGGIITVFMKTLIEIDSHDNDVFEDVVDYMENNYNEPDLLAKIHKKFYMNRGELSKKFREKTGMGMHEFLKNIKLDRAYNMLSDEGLKVSEVANLIGYENYGYFSQIFKKHYGVYPLEVKIKKILKIKNDLNL
ncbi:MAG: AraC family transcriptional regulator [Fusobacteriales bacterium]|nr:AraC family transcriptional regulator [Fusobacteriales bacterium]